MELLHRQTSLIRFAHAYRLEPSAGNTESAAVKWRETRIAKERGPMKTFHKMLIAGSLLAAAAELRKHQQSRRGRQKGSGNQHFVKRLHGTSFLCDPSLPPLYGGWFRIFHGGLRTINASK